MPQPEPHKIIYSMIRVSKFHAKKAVLKDISLSYFYGAKIGVIGLNGSGKSSLLRILADEDKDFLGETVISPGHTVGFLEQEPQLDESKTVREIVEQGVQPIVDLLKEFDEINNSFADPDATWFYIDPHMGQVVTRFTRRERLQRWIYHGFHSLDFNFWYYQGPAWTTAMVVLNAGGALLSIIGVILAFKRVGRGISRMRKSSKNRDAVASAAGSH